MSLKYCKDSPNIYNSVTRISVLARQFMEQNHGLISEAEALSFITTGNIPKNLKIKKFYREQRLDTAYKYACDICNFVEDKLVKESVLRSIKQSEEKSYIVYVYIDVMNEYQRSRARVLVNTIWYDFQQYKFEMDFD